jgi:hypothetical protein
MDVAVLPQFLAALRFDLILPGRLHKHLSEILNSFVQTLKVCLSLSRLLKACRPQG